VPATEVASRAGHGVAILLKIYAHCIDGQADAAKKPGSDGQGNRSHRPVVAVSRRYPWPARPWNPARTDI
jgi:hypothetical protein